MPGRLRPFIWIVVLLVVAAAFYATVRHKRDLVDFEVYRTAGARALAAAPLYRVEDGHYQFKYLPAFALAVAPLALLDPEVARVAWFTLSVGLLVAFVRLSLRELPERRHSKRVLGWLAFLLLGKCYVHELALGQSNLLLGILLVGAVFAARHGRRFLAGGLVAAAVFVKPYAIVLLPWLVLGVGAPALMGLLVVLGAGACLPAAVYGWSGNLHLVAEWYRTVTETTAPNLLFPENVSLIAMWTRWLGPNQAASALTVASVVMMLGLVAATWWKRRTVREPSYLDVGLVMLLVPLLSPQGWDYVLLLATPAVVCVVDRWRDLTAPWRAWSAIALAVNAFTVFDLLGRALYARLMGLSVVTLAVLALSATLVHLRWRRLA